MDTRLQQKWVFWSNEDVVDTHNSTHNVGLGAVLNINLSQVYCSNVALQEIYAEKLKFYHRIAVEKLES